MSEGAERSRGTKEGGRAAVGVGSVDEEDDDDREAVKAGEGVVSVFRNALASGFVRIRRGISSTIEAKVRLCSMRLEQEESHIKSSRSRK